MRNLFHQPINWFFRWVWIEICFFLTLNFGEYISTYESFNGLYIYIYYIYIYIYIYIYVSVCDPGFHALRVCQTDSHTLTCNIYMIHIHSYM